MATTSIRINRTTHERLKQLAEKEHSSLGEAIDELLDRYEQEEFRRSVHESFRRLREDPDAWADYKRELEEWDAVLMDGLADEPPCDDPNDTDEQ